MKIHILIDHDVDSKSENYLTVFQTKKELINGYIKLLFKYYPRHYHLTVKELQFSTDEADKEMFKAFKKESYDESLIDLEEYFNKYDCSWSYHVKFFE